MENKGTIVNLDDDPDFNRVLKVILKKEGYNLISALTPEDFAQKMRIEKPRLCLIDVNLDIGQGAGFTMVQAIRNKLGLELPVFVVSRRQSREDITRALELGATDFIPKPIDDTFLIQKINQYLAPTEKSKLPFFKVSERDWHCEFTYDARIVTVSEFGLTVESSHFISKDTYLELKGSVITNICQESKILKMKVNNSWIDEETKKFKAFCEFDVTNDNLMTGVRSFLITNRAPDQQP